MKHRHGHCRKRLLRVSRTGEPAAKPVCGFVGIVLLLRNTLYIGQRIFVVTRTGNKGVHRRELTISRGRVVLSYRERRRWPVLATPRTLKVRTGQPKVSSHEMFFKSLTP